MDVRYNKDKRTKLAAAAQESYLPSGLICGSLSAAHNDIASHRTTHYTSFFASFQEVGNAFCSPCICVDSVPPEGSIPPLCDPSGQAAPHFAVPPTAILIHFTLLTHPILSSRQFLGSESEKRRPLMEPACGCVRRFRLHTSCVTLCAAFRQRTAPRRFLFSGGE